MNWKINKKRFGKVLRVISSTVFWCTACFLGIVRYISNYEKISDYILLYIFIFIIIITLLLIFCIPLLRNYILESDENKSQTADDKCFENNKIITTTNEANVVNNKALNIKSDNKNRKINFRKDLILFMFLCIIVFLIIFYSIVVGICGDACINIIEVFFVILIYATLCCPLLMIPKSVSDTIKLIKDIKKYGK